MVTSAVLVPTCVSLADLCAPPDLRHALAHVSARVPPLECRNCGNPAITGGAPCRYCQVVTDARPNRLAWQCPKCGKVPVLESNRDVLRGETIFVVRCHGAHQRAVVTDDEMLDAIEAEGIRVLAADRIAEAIDAFAEADPS